MASNTEETIGNWCQCLSAKQVDEHLQALAMKTDGSKFIKMNRLSQWLLGICEPEDFQEDEEENENSLLIKRENLRTTFIAEKSKTELPPAWENISGESAGEDHPLTMLADDEITEANLDATRLAISTRLALSTREQTRNQDTETGDDTQQTGQHDIGNDTNQTSAVVYTTPHFNNTVNLWQR